MDNKDRSGPNHRPKPNISEKIEKKCLVLVVNPCSISCFEGYFMHNAME